MNTPPLAILLVTTDALWDTARAIRHRVFVEEQACPPEKEWDAHDWPTDRGRTCRHLVAVAPATPGGPPQPVGVCRWREVSTPEVPADLPSGERWAKLERFAVAPEARGRGIGRALVQAALDDARARGHTCFVLYAQDHLREFYGAWGFQASGEVFWDVGIPHVKMTLEG